MRNVPMVLAAVLLLGGCGSSGSDETSKTKPTAAASTTAPPARALKDTCPLVEASMRQAGSADWLPLPTTAQAGQLSTELGQLSDQGDTETKNAMVVLSAGVDPLVTTDPEPGMPTIAASQKLIGAIQGFADRCKAVGSSALQ